MTSAVELGPEAIVGSYRLEHQLGRGGMGTVFAARHVVLPRRAAIKIMHGDLRRQPGMANRVIQEATILETIQHPGVVRVYDCDLLADERPWIAMELVHGEPLATLLARRSVLNSSEVAMLLRDVAAVLAAAHERGVVHRDLKPDNLILTPADLDYPLRLIDWGVARLGPIGRNTLAGTTPGTPIYMSPEQAAGRNIAGPCDVYSLGVIAYETLTGRPPFDGRTLAEVVCMHLSRRPEPLSQLTNAPLELCRLIHAMLAKDPSARPNANEVRELADKLTEASPPYESFELAVASGRAVVTGGDDTVVVDPETLEFGITELLPVIPRPRWTPDATYALPEARRGGAIGPTAECDQVSGEIPKRRS
jgi:serine/threonine-protein kinase